MQNLYNFKIFWCARTLWKLLPAISVKYGRVHSAPQIRYQVLPWESVPVYLSFTGSLKWGILNLASLQNASTLQNLASDSQPLSGPL